MKIIGVCPKCSKNLVVKYDGKTMYWVACSNKKCDFKNDFKSDNKQSVIDNWNK